MLRDPIGYETNRDSTNPKPDFALEEIEYWAKKFAPKFWQTNLKRLEDAGWMLFKEKEREDKMNRNMAMAVAGDLDMDTEGQIYYNLPIRGVGSLETGDDVDMADC